MVHFVGAKFLLKPLLQCYDVHLLRTQRYLRRRLIVTLAPAKLLTEVIYIILQIRTL